MAEPAPHEVFWDEKAGIVQEWYCEPPEPGTRFRVYPGGDEWDDTGEVPVRRIYQIEEISDAPQDSTGDGPERAGPAGPGPGPAT